MSAIDVAAAPSSWQPLDLAAIVAGVQAGEIVGPVPALMLRTDGVPLLYPGEVHSLAGEPESGKGWIALACAAELLRDGARVLLLDFEDAAPNIVTRLLALGAPAAAIVDAFTYVRPDDALQPGTLAQLLDGTPYALAILDGATEAFALLGLDSYANQDVPRFLRTLARPIAATGAAVLLIDHVTKDRETRGRFALGAQHKLAGVTAAYGVDVIDPPSRTTAGRVKLTVHKDRPGHVRGHAAAGVIALVTIAPEDDGRTVTVTLDPPDSSTEDGTFRPTVLMARVSRFVEAAPGVSTRAIREGVRGKHDAKDLAVELLIAEGWVRVEQDGQARRHYTVEPFEPDQPCPRAPTVPHRAPGTPAADRAPVPPSYKEGHGHGAQHPPTVPGIDRAPLNALTADCADEGQAR